MLFRSCVNWLGKVKKDNLNEYVRELLRNRSIVTKFKHPSDIAELDKALDKSSENTPVQSTNVNIDEETLSRAMQVLNNALQSDNEGIRVKAAIGLLQYSK